TSFARSQHSRPLPINSSNFDNITSEHVGLIESSDHQIIELAVLPPKWVDIVDEVDEKIDKIKSLISTLESLHKKHVLPGFDDRTEEEKEIERLTKEITELFQQCQQKIRWIGDHGQTTALNQELVLSRNVQTSLATKVQELSTSFRKQQSAYMKRLKARETKIPGLFSIDSVDDDPKGGFTTNQLVMVESSEALVAQREREINEIAKSINTLAEIFKDLQTLVIDQGTLLDRIDYNVEQMVTNVKAAVKELDKQEDNVFRPIMSSEETLFTSFSPPLVNSNSSTAKSSSTTAHHLRPQTSLTTVVNAQICFLLNALLPDNYASKVSEINSLLNKHGQDTYFYLLRKLLIINKSQICNTGSGNSDPSPSYPLLIEKVKEAASDPSLSIVLCEAFNSINPVDSFKDFDLDNFLETVGINPVEKVSLCISLLPSNKKEIVEQAREIIRQNFDPLVKALEDQAIQANLSDKLLHHLIAYFKSHEVENLNISSQQSETASSAERSPFSSVPIGLIPLLSNQSVNSAKMSDPNESPQQSLSRLMRDAGYKCCNTLAAFTELVGQLGVKPHASEEIIKEDDIARAVGMMVETHSNLEEGENAWGQSPNAENDQTWNIEIFTTTLTDLQPHIDWNKVIEKLDYPEFVVNDVKGLEIILSAYKYGTKEKQLFPIHLFWGHWNNVKGQFSFLRRIIQAPAEMFSLSNYPVQKVLSLEDFATSSTNFKSMAGMLTSHPWNSVELIETLIKMADYGLFEEIRSLFDRITKQTPEVVCLGLAQVKKPWNALHQELLSRLLSMFLAGHSSSTPVLTRLWQINSNLFIEGCLEAYKKDAMTISRILDIAQDLKILNPLLAVQSFSFSIDLAALASRREYLNLEKWLQDNIIEHGDLFIHECLEFLNQKIALEVSRDTNGGFQSVRLSVDVIAIFLRILPNRNVSSMSAENSELLKEVRRNSMQVHPNLIGSTEGEVPGTEPSFSADVEEEANSYYERVYRQEITIEDMIKLLQRFKTSKDRRENDIFSCMVHNLFDEYQFFPKYPQKELTITSVIFGSLIQYQLVEYYALGIALRYVLNALRNPADSKMFNFGVQALRQFQSRLPEWPQYCSHLLQIPQLQQSFPDIVQTVKSALASNISAPATSSSVSTSSNINNIGNGDASSSQPINNSNTNVESINSMRLISESASKVIDKPAFTALNLDTLLTADKVDYGIPSEAVQDKILFNINNVAQSNLESKVAEMKELLKDSHYRWFANYLVVKRASIEPNYHQLYLQFLDALESPSLSKHVLHETYSNIKILLNSQKTVEMTSERSLLKNLGSWLGGMTLARNKPIKHKNIAFKELLIEGYDNNRLLVAIPFVCKVLEQASKSKVFKPPNPWLMAIIKLLAELYQYADLKLNLKFEVEVLCKSLNIDLKEIEPTTILKDRPPKGTVTIGFGQEWPNNPNHQPPSKVIPPDSQIPVQTTPAIHFGNITLSMNDDGNMNLDQYVTINSNLPSFYNQPVIRRSVYLAIDRAIREIITPVVERSVTIAGISTRELIVKDFAMEPNEEKMRNAAHLMVQNLAGSLALVTCKEPLRLSMVNHLKNLLFQNGYNEQNISEQAILMIVADNLELACSYIEKAAMDKALPEIDESLASSFSNRKKHRERTGQPYYDMTVYSGISRYMGNFPEPLRLKPNGLQPQQLRVYEDFSRIPRLSSQAAAIYDERNSRVSMHRGQEFPIGHNYNSAEIPFDGAQVHIPISAHQSLEKFNAYLSDLDKLISKTPQTTWSALPPNSEIRFLVKEIPILATQSFNRDETALHFSQKVMQLLYKNDSNLSREVYVTLLEKLCETSYKVTKEVTAWLIYADDERKFIVPVVVALIKANLINAGDQDAQLAKLIENGRPVVIDFTTKLIREIVLKDPPYATRNDFVNSLDALTRLTQRGKAPEAVIQLLEDLRLRTSRDSLSKDVENMGLRDQLALFFAEWVKVYQHPTLNEKTYANFIMQLQQQGVLKGEEISSMFFRVCTEMSVDHYLKQKLAHATPTISYQAIDAFSKLIVLLVKYHSDPEGVNNNVAKINYLTKILSIIVLVLAQAHEQRRQQFNQKPFFRLFSSLLNDLNSYEQQLQPIYFQILIALSSNTFHTLQPFFFPGFTFAWLSLISHRLFMPKLLLAENQKGWPAFHKLLICLFKFLVPFLRNVEMRDTTRLLYRGTLRVLLVLLHDFPEFLCDYHFSFCDVIPPSCIQLRNLILSAFPRNMRLPDPFTTPNLKVDLLPEISQSPRVLSDYSSALIANNLKNDIDTYLKTRTPIPFPIELKNKLMIDSSNQPDIASTGSKYNVPLINSLVLYIGIQAINKSSQGTLPLTHSVSMDIFQQLLVDMDSEGRYLLLSAIANQLRYPNSHTHYFSCILLYLFAEGNQEVIKEQVTRVLLERLIVNRPHPWGLLITFIELIKNPRYSFWNHSFTRCAADIERLFESVNR
ncbi:14374_t:CDS:10, partial [Acaulospora morrowiae]